MEVFLRSIFIDHLTVYGSYGYAWEMKKKNKKKNKKAVSDFSKESSGVSKSFFF